MSSRTKLFIAGGIIAIFLVTAAFICLSMGIGGASFFNRDNDKPAKDFNISKDSSEDGNFALPKDVRFAEDSMDGGGKSSLSMMVSTHDKENFNEDDKDNKQEELTRKVDTDGKAVKQNKKEEKQKTIVNDGERDHINKLTPISGRLSQTSKLKNTDIFNKNGRNGGGTQQSGEDTPDINDIKNGNVDVSKYAGNKEDAKKIEDAMKKINAGN